MLEVNYADLVILDLQEVEDGFDILDEQGQVGASYREVTVVFGQGYNSENGDYILEERDIIVLEKNPKAKLSDQGVYELQEELGDEDIEVLVGKYGKHNAVGFLDGDLVAFYWDYKIRAWVAGRLVQDPVKTMAGIPGFDILLRDKLKQIDGVDERVISAEEAEELGKKSEFRDITDEERLGLHRYWELKLEEIMRN